MPEQNQTRSAPLIAVAAIMVVLTNAIIFMLPPLLPVIQTEFGLTTLAQTTWLYTALTLGGGAGFILLPRLADLYGDRKASTIAAVLLTIGAVVPAIGNSYTTLIVGCVLMGLGGASQLLPLGFLRRNLGNRGITVGVAVLVIATGGGIVVGMIGAGYVLESLSVRAVFAALAVMCAGTSVASWIIIPSAALSERSGSLGVVSTMWMIAWVTAILLTLTQGLVWGDAAIIPLVLGIAGAITWWRAERRSSSAVFDPALMKAPSVMLACVAIASFAAMNAAFLLLLSTYVQTDPAQLPLLDSYGLGLSTLQTGWLMVPFALAFVIGGAVVDTHVNNGHGVRVLLLGAAMCAAGLGWLAMDHTAAWHYVVGSVVMGLGCSIGYAAGFSLVQRASSEEKAGMAAGVAGTFMAFGFALGTALVSAELSADMVTEPATGVKVANAHLFEVGYWAAAAFGIVILGSVFVHRTRARNRAPHVAIA